MENKDKRFYRVVIIIVVVVGAGFGTLAGFIYSPVFFWVATLLGVVGGYAVGKLYLWWLAKICAKGYKRFVMWLLGSVVGALCGIGCTTLIHGIMAILSILILKFDSEVSGGLLPFVVMGAEVVGAGEGFVVGGICSWVYVLKIADNVDESSNDA